MNSSCSNHIQAIVGFIDQHYAENLVIEELAQRMSLSLRQFERLFKETTGMSAQAYLLEKRLQRALSLLIETNAKVDKVFEQAGFGSRRYFYRLFSIRTGLSPKRFRKLAQATSLTTIQPEYTM